MTLDIQGQANEKEFCYPCKIIVIKTGSSILNAVSSLLTALGPEGLLVIMEGVSDAFDKQQTRQGTKEAALVIVSETMLSFSEPPVQGVDWFAAFISNPICGCHGVPLTF